jgi:hypothetical protein
MITKLRPTEKTLREVGIIPVDKYIAGNVDGVVSNVKQNYNLNLARKSLSANRRGISNGEDSISIMKTIETIEKKDTTLRLVAGIQSKSLLGVPRRFLLHPTLNIYLHTRSNLLICAEMSRVGKLVLTINSTGDMWDLPKTDKDRQGRKDSP